NRGGELDGIVALLKDTKNVEVSAVCDLWTHNLERAVAANQKYYGKAPRALKHPQELLALKDVDAVMISTPEHSHSPILKLTAEAGKDAYCEKPMGNVLEEVKAARDAVVARNLIAQVGTQDRKSTRLNSSHVAISYAVFCLKKKKKTDQLIDKGTQGGPAENLQRSHHRAHTAIR